MPHAARLRALWLVSLGARGAGLPTAASPLSLFLSVLPGPKRPKLVLIFLKRVVACDKHRVRVSMPVERGAGGEARLRLHFSQSSLEQGWCVVNRALSTTTECVPHGSVG